MTEAPPPNKGFTDAAVSDAAEVGKSLIQGIAPAEKGWVLGFIIVVAIIVLSDMWVGIKTLETNVAISQSNRVYFTLVEENRMKAMDKQAQTFSDQVRRSQEVIRDLAQAVSRDSERSGMAAMAAVSARSDTLENMDPEFIGPPAPER